MLAGATNSQIGDLGEETCVVHLEGNGATIIAIGDAGMPRNGSRQDLDVVAEVDGYLVVFEVKTTYVGRRAGRRTAAGNLYRPRLRRIRATHGHAGTGRQGSQEYATERLDELIDLDSDFPGVKVRVAVVDLRAMLLQQFAVDDGGRITGPVGPAADCSDAALAAYGRIVEHRGRL